nr:hypothetical protein [Candidatus Sigynarchaeota archaeon]
MGYNYYRKIADQEQNLDPETINQVIKYSVLPTLASGTFLFTITMFLTYMLPYDIGSYILGMIAYFALTILTFALGSAGKNNAALVCFYGMCVATGLFQRIVLAWAVDYLGSVVEMQQLFTIAVLAATAVLVAITILVRASPKMFSAGSGFMRWGLWIAIFGMVGLSIWTFAGLFLGNFDLYLLVASLIGVFIAGIYTIYDIGTLRRNVASGRWVYGTARIALNYFILILRIFMLLVLGRKRH